MIFSTGSTIARGSTLHPFTRHLKRALLLLPLKCFLKLPDGLSGAHQPNRQLQLQRHCSLGMFNMLAPSTATASPPFRQEAATLTSTRSTTPAVAQERVPSLASRRQHLSRTSNSIPDNYHHRHHRHRNRWIIQIGNFCSQPLVPRARRCKHYTLNF